MALIDLLFEGTIPTAALRTFAVLWCASRTWHLIQSSADYDLDPRARLHFAYALNTARREAHGRATVAELTAAWIDALDERAAKTGWWPERLASRAAFASAAQMAARFACLAACHPDATVAALSSSHSTAWAIGYRAASIRVAHQLYLVGRESLGSSWHARWGSTLGVAQRIADEARTIEEDVHARELRRRIAEGRSLQRNGSM